MFMMLVSLASAWVMHLTNLTIAMFLQEYGTGRFNRKHSSFYGKNMKQLGLCVEPEHYFDICPWQTLAVINLEFIFSERRRNYLKFAGGLCYFEVPSAPPAPW